MLDGRAVAPTDGKSQLVFLQVYRAAPNYRKRRACIIDYLIGGCVAKWYLYVRLSTVIESPSSTLLRLMG